MRELSCQHDIFHASFWNNDYTNGFNNNAFQLMMSWVRAGQVLLEDYMQGLSISLSCEHAEAIVHIVS